MKLNLTDSEWISLLDGESDDSQLGTCCANISSLRDQFMLLVRSGRNEEIMEWELTDLKRKIKWVADGHELSPLLIKICEQIGFDPEEEEHKKGFVE